MSPVKADSGVAVDISEPAATTADESTATPPDAAGFNEDEERARASALIADGLFAEAAAELSGLWFPFTADRLVRAWCLTRANSWQLAIDAAEEANVVEETAQAHYLIAFAVTRGQEFAYGEVTKAHLERAKEHLERAVSLPGAESHVSLALAKRIHGHDDLSVQRRIALALRAVELDEGAVEPRLFAATQLMNAGAEYARALELLQPLLERDAPASEACWLAAHALANSGAYRDAVRVLKQLRTKGPADARALDAQMAFWLEDAGDTDVAIERLNRVATSDHPEIRYLGLTQRARVRLALADRGSSDLESALRSLIVRDLLAAADDSLVAEMGAFAHPAVHATDGGYEILAVPPVTNTVLTVLSRQSRWPLDDSERARLAVVALREASDYGEPLAPERQRELAMMAEPAAQCSAAARVLGWAWYELGEHLRALELFIASALARYREAPPADPGDVFGSSALPWIVPALLEEPLLQEAADKVEAMGRTMLETSGTGIDAVTVAFYNEVWRRVLIAAERYADLRDVADTLVARGTAILGTDFIGEFDGAFACHRLSLHDEAERRYRQLIRHTEHPTALHNLSLICRARGAYDEALVLAQRALAASPDSDVIVENVQAIEHAIADRAGTRASAGGRHVRQRPERRTPETMPRAGRNDDADQASPQMPASGARLPELESADEVFLRTAPERWPMLDRYKRQLLAALTVIPAFRDWQELERLSGVEARYLPGHWRKLVEAGMVIERGAEWSINIHVRTLVEKERMHAVATRFIRADESVAFKPVFNSRQEYTVYGILLGLFPNQLVFPNMGLQAVFQYERMRELLGNEDFGYYLRAQVDFCIVSTSTYFPIIAFELDSPYHDAADQQMRDERKDLIFQRGGVPLIRLRSYGRPTVDGMRGDIIAAVQSAVGAMLQVDARARERLAELDIVALGVSALGDALKA